MRPTARRRPRPRTAPVPLAIALASALAAFAAATPAPTSGITANGRLAVGGEAAPARVAAPAAPAAPPAPPPSAAAEDRSGAIGRRPLGPAPSASTSIGGASADAAREAREAGEAGEAASGESPGLPGPGPLGVGGGAGELLKTGGALGVVLAIAVVLSRFVKRLGGVAAAGRPAGVLEILARYPVGRGQQLVVLRLDRRVLLVHQAGGRMEPLTEVTDPDEVARLVGRLEAGASAGDADRFRRVLAELEHGRGPDALRPDGTLPGESRRHRGRVAAAAADALETGPARPATGLAAAIRAGRRAAAYGAARGAGVPAGAPAAALEAAGDDRPEIEVVDLTRRGRGGRR